MYIDNELYEKIKQVMPILCVDLVVHLNQCFLLCRRNNAPAKGEWWFPGGRVHRGETLEEAAIRKAKEELSIDVSIERQIGIYDLICPTTHTPTVVYLVKPVDEVADIQLDGQHSTYRWVNSAHGVVSYIRRVVADSGVL